MEMSDYQFMFLTRGELQSRVRFQEAARLAAECANGNDRIFGHRLQSGPEGLLRDTRRPRLTIWPPCMTSKMKPCCISLS